MPFWQKIFQKICQTNKRAKHFSLSLLKGFEMQHAEGASEVSGSLAGNNNVSVMGILLTSCFV